MTLSQPHVQNAVYNDTQSLSVHELTAIYFDTVMREITISDWCAWKQELAEHLYWWSRRTWHEGELTEQKQSFIDRYETYKISLTK